MECAVGARQHADRLELGIWEYLRTKAVGIHAAVHLRMVALMEEAGLPPGTINVVNGSGAVTGAALAGSPDIDRIAFTGGGSTAKQVMTAAATHHARAFRTGRQVGQYRF